MSAPRRRVVDAIEGPSQHFMCMLSCGHSAQTRRRVDNFAQPIGAPKTMQCERCDTVKAGDYFLLPFAGHERDLLVCAVEPDVAGHWRVSNANGKLQPSGVLLTSCTRITPARAQRIIKGALTC